MAGLTKKQLIQIEYIKMQERVRGVVSDDCARFMPDVSEVDIVDFLFYFNLFCNGCEQTGYRDVVRLYMASNNITVPETDFERGYPHVETFLNWLRQLH